MNLSGLSRRLALAFVVPLLFGGLLLAFGQFVPLRISQPISDGTAVGDADGWVGQSFLARTPGLDQISIRVADGQVPEDQVVFLPQYTFISASYNNDNPAPPLITASLFFLVRGYRKEADSRHLALALLFGLMALTAKRPAVAIVPMLGLALLGYALKWLCSERRWARIRGGRVWAGAAVFLTGLVFIALQPPTVPPGIARQLRLSPNALIQLASNLSLTGRLDQIDWGWFFTHLLESFWGQFGWLTLRIPAFLRDSFTLLTIMLTLGLLGELGRDLKESADDPVLTVPFSAGLFITGILFTPAAMIARYLISPEFYPPQGRYLFPFFPALAIIGIWSWLSFWPRRFQTSALISTWIVLLFYDLDAWAYVILPGWYS